MENIKFTRNTLLVALLLGLSALLLNQGPGGDSVSVGIKVTGAFAFLVSIGTLPRTIPEVISRFSKKHWIGFCVLSLLLLLGISLGQVMVGSSLSVGLLLGNIMLSVIIVFYILLVYLSYQKK